MSTSPVTRGKLITRVATRANTSGYADATTPDGEVSQLVDLGLAKMHNLLVGLYQDYFTRMHDIIVVGGEDTYTLPSNYMKCRQVFFVDSSGYRYPLREFQIADLSNVPSTASMVGCPLGYVIMNNQFVVLPKPPSTQSNVKLLMFYIPVYEPPVNDSTPIEYAVAFGWDEWVVNDAVVQIRTKAMMPTDDVAAEREKLERAIHHQARQRNAGDPQRVRNNGWNGSGAGWPQGQFAFKP